MQFNQTTLSNISDARIQCIDSFDESKSYISYDRLNTLYKLSTSLFNSSNIGCAPRFRYKWIVEFGWCVPTIEFIDRLQRFVQNYGSIVFPAAGLAWLPMLVLLTPCRDGSYFDRTRVIVSDICRSANIWYPVTIEDGVQTSNHTKAGDTMVISWAPDFTELGTNMLKAFNGNQLIVIGEGDGGNTASKSFFIELSENWIEDTSENGVYIRQWNGTHDNATFYHRRHKTVKHINRIFSIDATIMPFLLNRLYIYQINQIKC